MLSQSDRTNNETAWNEVGHLGGEVEAVLNALVNGVVTVQGKPRLARVPDAGFCVEGLDELLHRGGPVKAHHLDPQGANGNH